MKRPLRLLIEPAGQFIMWAIRCGRGVGASRRLLRLLRLFASPKTLNSQSPWVAYVPVVEICGMRLLKTFYVTNGNILGRPPANLLVLSYWKHRILIMTLSRLVERW